MDELRVLVEVTSLTRDGLVTICLARLSASLYDEKVMEYTHTTHSISGVLFSLVRVQCSNTSQLCSFHNEIIYRVITGKKLTTHYMFSEDRLPEIFEIRMPECLFSREPLIRIIGTQLSDEITTLFASMLHVRSCYALAILPGEVELHVSRLTIHRYLLFILCQ